MKFKIVSDSSSNLTRPGFVEKVPFASVPLHVIVGEQHFVDDETFDIDAMQAALDAYKGATSTSCPSPQDWIQAFGDAQTVFCVTITSALSGSYSSCNVAKQMYEDQYPDRKVYIVDSLSTGPEMALIIDRLQEMILKDMDPEEIDKAIQVYHQNTHLLFSLASLNNLAKNGRVSPLIAKGIGILGLRIVGEASPEGTLNPLTKGRGDKKSLPIIVDLIKKKGYRGGRIYFSHTGNLAAVETLKNLLVEEFGAFEYKIYDNTALCSYYAEPQCVLVAFETK